MIEVYCNMNTIRHISKRIYDSMIDVSLNNKIKLYANVNTRNNLP